MDLTGAEVSRSSWTDGCTAVKRGQSGAPLVLGLPVAAKRVQ